jgi:hypothetical protein
MIRLPDQCSQELLRWSANKLGDPDLINHSNTLAEMAFLLSNDATLEKFVHENFEAQQFM